ncbi:Transposase, partial [Aphelenchoides avenae]
VEIHESLFSRRKYKRGRRQGGKKARKEKKALWWFGGICRETRDVFLCYVEEYVHEDSIIVSDQWAAYRRLCTVGFEHFTVNHSKNFVAPEDCTVHTQRIECHWGVAKQHLRERHAKHPEFIEGYLADGDWCYKCAPNGPLADE